MSGTECPEEEVGAGRGVLGLAGGAGRGLRAAWLGTGGVLLALLLVELGSRGAVFLKRLALPPPPPVADARAAADGYRGETWPAAYFEEHWAAGVRWEPYVYWRRRPFRGRYVNVGEDGRRRTVPAPGAEPPAGAPRVFVFGGSTVWGTGSRDAHTLPSELAAALAKHGLSARVENFGETGYVSTQEVVALLLELRRGNVPDLAIFYDGVNDAFAAYQGGVAGIPQNESNRVREFNLLKPERQGEVARILAADLLGRSEALALLRRVVRRGGPARRRAPPGARDPEALGREAARTWLGNAGLVRALAGAYRFRALFYWQPTLLTKERRSPWEREQVRKVAPELARLHAAARAFLARAATGDGAPGFSDLGDLFSGSAEPLYIDPYHLTERGNRLVAERMAPDALALLGE